MDCQSLPATLSIFGKEEDVDGGTRGESASTSVMQQSIEEGQMGLEMDANSELGCGPPTRVFDTRAGACSLKNIRCF
jgi:hypothetical protein